MPPQIIWSYFGFHSPPLKSLTLTLKSPIPEEVGGRDVELGSHLRFDGRIIAPAAPRAEH